MDTHFSTKIRYNSSLYKSTLKQSLLLLAQFQLLATNTECVINFANLLLVVIR